MATTAGVDFDRAALPRRIRQLNWRTWRGVLVRAGKGFVKDNCSDWAASLTYYTVLALFPSAIVVVALVNLVSKGDQTVNTVVGLLRDMGASSLVDNQGVVDAIEGVVSQKSAAGVLLSFGLLTAIWSASGYVGGFTRASNAIYGVEEGRPIWKLRPLQILLTMAALVLLALVALMLIVSGPVTTVLGERLGLGEAPRLAWTVAKWPVLVLIAMLLLALLFWIAPNVRQPRFRWLTVGGFITLLAVGLASFGFGLYVANFGSYDKTYGSLGAVIAFLVWVYLVNSAVMFGVEVNAEVQRGRELQAGADHVDDPVLPPREPAD
ncbi:YihY/virulence factor BrkB family protein [Asanoa sp. WMMD1127]|uniref:YihY/virulence factor BrkB family protein n=1 Tax=Asanoa sp. WMMD1127 TaxID=3016107 RepID=UPI002417FE82|nr:YihY/virulence factor BrkB family protein [Asanoa sp. WMMD1127]MDG4824333.1 YihY/virulence factor BrkB family protein [Asanoa sp. WMMD1127]